ncbi:hypothetical protein JW979_02370 [bacterium]|nr:hypothetical protein [candidate division CSSED10-310 bacterium]
MPTLLDILYLITPSALEIVVQEEWSEFGSCKRKVRAKFTYKRQIYILPITDPVVEKFYLAMDDNVHRVEKPERRIYMCISLGLPYSEDNHCYKFAASMIKKK